MAFFEAKNIVKQYAGHTALKDVSISVPEGSIFGLLGPNGAGKTTLIRIINQITGPDSGEIFFNGEPLKPEHVHQIGYLPEERGLYKKMKVGEQSIYLAQLKGMSKKDATAKLQMWFKKFEILEWWDKKVEELSKGMAQKIQFVTTILHEPKLLIFDEPFSGFDPINANLLKSEILKLRDNGSTIIFSTHNMGSVEEICDHIALIHKSEKILDGSFEDIKKEYRTNTYNISFTGELEKIKANLPKDVEILEHKSGKEFESLKLKLNNGISSNQLLSQLLPHVEIIAFNEIIPSMNDIFIRVVNEKNLSIDME
ncbi:ABC transporter ATP-binding protein [Ancylomarina sp. 16SWW S1-10-2]|uniref:ABC transporter ATP-binding protein n=1 Tax=Ancylomarina sp. 16SWW S1-10-2 TaxID=2499681 RepID=UPI0012AE2E1C|nr:ATP-binding cassette domain-containing protein [Ancylomarina sp. 16SWW S1-10-2]MRT91503.1 ABC transporter ATP-binding protein [Ancylomarina sp. 16SWW S1-10-2]